MSSVSLHPVVVSNSGELNTLLARFQLPKVPAAALEPLRAKVGRSNLIRALSILNSPEAEHGAARQYLLSAITDACKKAGVEVSACAPADEIPAVPATAPRPATQSATPRPSGPAASAPAAAQVARAPARPAAPRAPAAQTPAANDAPHSSPPEPAAARPQRLQARAYGKGAALCAEDDETRGGEPTVSIELAPATGPRDYNWSKKVRFQLTSDELPQLLAVLCGYAAGVRFSNHGADNKKWLQVEYQPKGYYIKGGDGESMMVLPVSAAGDQTGLYALTLRQARRAAFGIDSLALLQYVRTSIAPKIHPPTQQREAAVAGRARG